MSNILLFLYTGNCKVIGYFQHLNASQFDGYVNMGNLLLVGLLKKHGSFFNLIKYNFQTIILLKTFYSKALLTADRRVETP